MHIANPIYDVVFKYLMEDPDIAKLMISTIISEDIVALDFLPQESTMKLPYHSLTVYRLDFSAKIRRADGTMKHVIIEIQKAKFATDIMRFRQYLGAQYQKKDNAYTVTIDGKEIKKAMPVVSIYFLGYRLDHTTAPVIKVARKYYDVTTGQEICEHEEFIESLTHDSYVIQIPHLKPEHKTEIEDLLSIFDQHFVTSDRHVLQVHEKEYPRKYRKLIRRLQRAIVEPEVQRSMDVEDEILEELQDLEREKLKAVEEKDKAIEEKDKELEEKNKVIEEQRKMIEALRKQAQSEE